MRARKKLIAFVTVECVTCETRKNIQPGEIGPGDMPLCDRCYSPMVAIKAEVRNLQEDSQ